jgi:predicted ABC-type transport system involved in lysophospholipase L1 biosynthesis ATPase subunit
MDKTLHTPARLTGAEQQELALVRAKVREALAMVEGIITKAEARIEPDDSMADIYEADFQTGRTTTAFQAGYNAGQADQ